MLDGKLLQLKPLVMAALQSFKASQQQIMYPEANGSLRVSFGIVQGVQPRDGVYYLPFSSSGNSGTSDRFCHRYKKATASTIAAADFSDYAQQR